MTNIRYVRDHHDFYELILLWLQATLFAFCDHRAPLLQCPWVVILYLYQKCTRKERSFQKILFSNGINSTSKKVLLLQLAENEILFDILISLRLDPLPSDEQSQLSKGIL